MGTYFKLPYERFDQLVLIAASKHPIQQIQLTTQQLELSYEEYVKSQLHLNVTSDLFNRKMVDYHNALLFLRGDESKKNSALVVLRYFYQDVCSFLANNPNDVDVLVTAPDCLKSLCGTTEISATATGKDLRQLLVELREHDGDIEAVMQIIATSKCSAVFDSARDIGAIEAKQHSYVVLTMLQQILNEDKLCILVQTP